MPVHKTKTKKIINNASGVHTMQDDLAKAPPPSRFDLRHRRPLPKSERMEDLRTPPKNNKFEDFPLPSINHTQTLQAPTKEQNILSNPALLWILGLALGLILSTIILAIVITVG